MHLKKNNPTRNSKFVTCRLDVSKELIFEIIELLTLVMDIVENLVRRQDRGNTWRPPRAS